MVRAPARIHGAGRRPRVLHGLALAYLLVVGAACLEPGAQPCGADKICPPHLVCNITGEACVLPDLFTCGNKDIDSDNEECDDGNNRDGDGCRSNCRYDICGDTVVAASNLFLGREEECDCGSTAELAEQAGSECNARPNSDEGGYCRADCLLHCGDGQIVGDEECDGRNLGGNTSCVDIGFDYGVLSCNTRCRFNACGRIGWYKEELSPETPAKLRAAWGSGDRVFIVGDRGAMWHHNGSTWQPIDVPAPDDLLAVGGWSSSGVYAGGKRGRIVHYNGSTAEVSSTGRSTDVIGIWAASPADIFALSKNGELMRREVTIIPPAGPNSEDQVTVTWRLVVGITDNGAALWGRGPEDIYIVSRTGRIHHYSGDVTQVVPTEGSYRAIWGAGGHIIAVGDSGAILRHDGERWRSESSGTAADLTSVWGSGPDDIYAAGDNGTMLYYGGKSWKQLDAMPSNVQPGEYTPQSFVSGWSISSDQVFALDANTPDGIWRYHGMAWGVDLNQTDMGGLRAVWGQDPSDVLLATSDGEQGAIWHYDGEEYTHMTDTPAPMQGMWGQKTCERETGWCTVYAVGEDATIMRYSDRSWETIDTSWLGDELVDLTSVWMSPDGHVFAAGTGSTVLRYDARNDLWSSDSVPDAEVELTAVWGRTWDDVFVAGTNGQVYHYDGESWNPSWLNGTHPPPVYGLWGNDSEVYAVTGVSKSSLRAEILQYRYAEDRWKQVADIHVADDLRAVWTDDSGQVYAVGDRGALVHSEDGAVWSPVRTDTSNQLAAIWGSESAVFFAGDNGTLLKLESALGSQLTLRTRTPAE